MGCARSFASISNFETDIELPYNKIMERFQIVRSKLGSRPLTLAEKIVYSHLDDPSTVASVKRGESYLKLRPDRYVVKKKKNNNKKNNKKTKH